MGFLDRLRERGTDDRVVVRNDRHRSKLVRTIEDRLVDLETAKDAPLLEVQPLIQIVGSRGYPTWRDGWARSWQKKRLPWSTASWPAKLPSTELAALLVPISAGRVGIALGKHPRPVSEPTFITGLVPDDGSTDDLALAITAHWMQHLAPAGLCPAPPVVETIVHGKVDERRAVDFGVAWSLPEPDGL